VAQRLVQIVTAAGQGAELRELLKEVPVRDRWDLPAADDRLLTTLLLPAGETEPLLDRLEQRFGGDASFRILLLPVEASLPKQEEEKSAAERERISRAELYEDIEGTCKVSPVYFVMTTLSTVVAAVGLLRDNVAVVIGAMVIAPLLGPNVALAFATTLGDGPLARRALRANLAGMTLALALSVLFGLLLAVPEDGREIASRTEAGLTDVALALAAGVAGCMAFTAGVSTALVGVMVAVALLPPLAVFGMLVGAGDWPRASGALLLLVTNLICVNLAGVVTFMAQGIRPRTWWDADRARRATRFAVAAWIVLLAILSVVIVVAFGL